MGARGQFAGMSIGGRLTIPRDTALALAFSLALAGPAWAQAAGDVNTFQLPPGTPVLAPPPPVIVPTTAASPAAKPSAAPTPRATPSPRPRPVPTAAASPTPAPRAIERPSALPASAPATVPAPIANPTPAALPLPIDAAPIATASAPAAVEAPSQSAPIWPWLAAVGVILAGAAVWLLRRRKSAAPETYYEEEEAAYTPPVLQPSPPAALAKPVQTMPEPALSLADVPPPAPVRAPQAQPHAAPTPAPQSAMPTAPAKAGDFISVALAARRLSATLMNTALTYELTVTNNGTEAIGPIAVSGDMIGAHASIPPKMLLETAADGEPHHRIPRLEPGESAAMSGELRLPLAAITPIRSGTATLFVPLARFRVLAFRDGRPPVSANHAFVVGEEPQIAGAALKPFRLDLGPRLYSSITQRELALPA
jgi:hypothetical protein